MHRMPRALGQYQLCLYDAHPRPTVRLAVKNTYLLGAVLLVSILGCAGDEAGISATMNELATLVGELPANPLQGKVITSAVSPGDSTMSTLYGNDLAARCARTNLKHDYPSGAVLSLEGRCHRVLTSLNPPG